MESLFFGVSNCVVASVYHFRHERSLFSAEQISHISRTVCSHISPTGHKSRRGERTHKQALTAPPIPIYPHPPLLLSRHAKNCEFHVNCITKWHTKYAECLNIYFCMGAFSKQIRPLSPCVIIWIKWGKYVMLFDF